MHIKTCKKCGKEFRKKYNESKRFWQSRLYCSKSCANSVNSLGNKYNLNRTPWNKGLKGKSGKDNPRYTSIGKICVQCGKKFTVRNYRKDTAVCCSVACAHRYIDHGKSSLNEKLRKSEKFQIWRCSVYKRDKYICQKCGKHTQDLHPHHIYNFAQYPEFQFFPSNGITLCKKCHINFHQKYGRLDNNHHQLADYFQRQKLLIEA